ncbi:MAG TPA: radical SAM protein [Dissulfurispiraceae bacterium]|nr:radical SAM protein [Dissulfurispiraceae bacterium]
MKYYLAPHCALKRLEEPCVYHVKRDELYELDEQAFAYLAVAAEPSGAVPPLDREFLSFCLSEGLLVTSPVCMTRPEPVQSPLPSLRYLELQITTRCNLRCHHCYVGDPERTELSLDDLKRVLDEFQGMQGLRLLITGGEPSLHTQFHEFNQLLPSYAFRKVLFTNGQMLGDRVIGQLAVDEIQISIDGLEKGHDALRGKGTFRKAFVEAERAIRAGIPVSVATVVHRQNLDEFEGMSALFPGIGILDWTVDVPTPAGFFSEHPELQVPPDVAGRYLSYGFGGGIHSGGDGFACGLHLASVLANGEVCKCAFYPASPAGTLREGLARAWSRIRPVSLDELDCATAGCPVLGECRGGCRYRAERSAPEHMPGNRKRRTPDFYKCHAYGIIK